MQSSISRRSLLNYAGVAILIAGIGTGEFIYWRSLQGGTGSGTGDDSLILLADSKAYDRQMEVNAGTFGLIMDQWMRSVAKLGEPGPLAITISVVSILAAGGCFLVASRQSR